jgi:hypothetical protein
MSQGLVERQNLEDIADAIRSKNGSSDTYTPAEMAQAISGIHTADEVVLVQKTVNSNGQYNASDDSADGYSGVRVNVPNSYAAADEGKVVSGGALVAQTSKNITSNGTHNTTTNNEVVVNVPNTYSASDNGKVVSSGALVAQTSRSVTANGTYDTTKNNEVIVNVPTGGGGGGTLLPIEYQEVEYVKVANIGPYIDTGVKSSSTAYYEITAKYDDTPLDNYGIFGTMHGGEYVVNTYGGTSYFKAGGDNGNLASDEVLIKHNYKADNNGIFLDGTRVGGVNWDKALNRYNYHLFAFIYQDGTIYKTANARIYSCKIWTGGFVVRKLIPCYRKSDDVIGFYDICNDEFLINNGTSTFEKGADI